MEFFGRHTSARYFTLGLKHGLWLRPLIMLARLMNHIKTIIVAEYFVKGATVPPLVVAEGFVFVLSFALG